MSENIGVMTKEKIYFIRINFWERNKFRHPIHFVPPMTLKYAQSLLEKEDEYVIEIIDCCTERVPMNSLVDRVLEPSPRAVVVSVPSFGCDKAFSFVSMLKQNNNEILTIGVGHGVTLIPDMKNLSQKNPFDIVFYGEAEQEIAMVIRNLKRFITIGEIKKFLSKQGDFSNVIFSKKLDDLPYPRFTREELEKYSFIYPVALNKKVVCGYIISSRGCNYSCVFCTQAIRKSYTNTIRFRSADNVVNEIEKLAAVGVNLIFFIDDNFSASKAHIAGICKEIIKRGLNIKWVASVRIDEIDSSLLKIMKDANCVLLLLSVESGSERVLKLLNKTPAPEVWIDKTKHVFFQAGKLGIGTCALFMVGSPTETKADVERSIQLAKALNPDLIKIHFFTPYPGTKIYGQFKEKLPVEKTSLMHHYLLPVVNLSNMDMRTMRKMQVYFYKKVMLRPAYITNNFNKYKFFYWHNMTIFRLLFFSFFRILRIR